MIPAQLKARDRELRDAIARGEYGDLDELLEGLRVAAEENLQRTRDPVARREIARWMLATIEWARLMLTAQRQRWAEELEALPRVDRFLAGTAVGASSEMCVDL
ncbi:MAG TPA: hypothetical protein VFT60_03990 [Bryobacteraceae bacterium]|nr:hypothetical protein [Bryobacteraceae bacterium]